MQTELIPVASLFSGGNSILPLLLKDFKKEDQFFRPDEKSNSINWIVGHIVATRYSVANILKLENQIEWQKLYTRGAELTDISKYPDIDEVMSAFRPIGDAILSKLENMSVDELKESVPFTPPLGEPNVLGALTFLGWHESYHIGQIAYAKRLLGYEQPFG